MKKWIVSSLAVAICVMISLPLAAQDKKEEKKGPPRGGRYQEIIKKFDKDGDGKLSDEEKAAARKAMQEHRAKREADQPKKETPEK